MKTLNHDIENHYLKEGLFEDIISRLKQQDINLEQIKRSDIASVDEFHVRGAEVSKELAAKINLKDANVLDVGCGLGGPCRMLADEYDCQTTGIDLSHEYIRTAKKLSKLVKLDAKTTFIQGDATSLPFEDSSFDVVWTQHVQMNIPNKAALYSEISRVLKPGGRFIYYDIFKKNEGEINYPMPWASTEDLSFLFKEKEMHGFLTQSGLTQEHATDETMPGIKFINGLLNKIKKFGPPTMGLNVLMGATTKDKIVNALGHLKSGELEIKSGIYKK